MKRWAVLTVFLYAIALLLLTVPVIASAFGDWGAKKPFNLQDSLKAFTTWGYWAWVAFFASGQYLLLLYPVSLAERRPTAQRPIKTLIIVSAFFLALLLLTGLASLLCAGFKEEGMAVFYYFAPLAMDPTHLGNWNSMGSLLVTLLTLWLIWAVIFRHFANNDEPEALLKRCIRWLLRGSILELLIAVPSHIMVRRRGDCCADFYTFWGIATGISLMLLCFGPGVYYLFWKRIGQLDPSAHESSEPNKPG